MNALTLVLRLIHILGGVFWVGAAWMMTLYIAPSVGATGDSGLQFMRHMMGKTNLQKMLIVSSISTVIAGTILYARNPPRGLARMRASASASERSSHSSVSSSGC